MSGKLLSEKSKSGYKGGIFFSVLCNILGTLILLSVILICLPVTVPRLMGYEIFNVVSGSMEPKIPTGSAVYVKAVEARDVQEGDIIAFWSGESVITHRVVENQIVEGEFTTKGDANEKEDINPVPYDALVGKVMLHFPILGDLMAVLTGTVGKIYMFCFAVCGIMFHILARRIRERKK